MEQPRLALPEVTFCEGPYECVAHALVFVTESKRSTSTASSRQWQRRR
jgi:hypothetical protein